MKTISVASLILFISAVISCNGPGTGGGVLSVSVKNSTRPAGLKTEAALPEALRVESFRVVISGEGMSPIEVSFQGDTSEGTISGIPVGEDRKVLIEALNASGRVVRRRVLSGVKIGGGGPTPIVATLLSVPLVISPAEGSPVTQTRLSLQGYAEPGGALEITDLSDNSSSLLTDLNTASNQISPSLSDGAFVFQPAVLPLGIHTFLIKDPSSGEETQVTLTLVRPGRQPGASFQAAGALTKGLSSRTGTGDASLEVLDRL